MPRRDGTGPEGKGSKTGRGLGNCSDDKVVVTSKPRLGLGRANCGGRRGK